MKYLKNKHNNSQAELPKPILQLGQKVGQILVQTDAGGGAQGRRVGPPRLPVAPAVAVVEGGAEGEVVRLHHGQHLLHVGPDCVAGGR